MTATQEGQVPSLWEVIGRSRTGETVEEKNFDMSIFRACERLKRKYDLHYHPEEPIPCDDQMADRVFAAGLELYEELGTYVLDTERVVKFTRGEIEAALARAPSETYFGEGAERVRMVHRDVEGSQEPIVFAGIQTAIFSDDDMAFRIYRECARDLCVDGIWGGVVFMLEGKYEVMAGTPMEIYAYRRHIEVMRRAVTAAGRPGLVIINNAPMSIATVAMYDREVGLRPSDRCNSSGISELRVAYDDLDRAAYGLAAGQVIQGSCPTVLGGMPGSVEGTAIVAVAGAFQALMVNQAQVTGASVTPFRERSRATRAGMWAESLALQGLTRNTHLILRGAHGDHPAAGPGTKQYFYESAAGLIAVTVSGGQQGGGTRKFVIGPTPNYGTPLESRWLGEASKSAAGMTRQQANEVVRYLLGKYESSLKDPPAGATYEDLYDQKTDEPTPQYQELYEEVKAELAGIGFPVRSWPRTAVRA